MTDTSKEQKKERDYQKEGIEVIFRKSTPISEPGNRYPGFEPGTTTLPKGSVHREGALPMGHVHHAGDGHHADLARRRHPQRQLFPDPDPGHRVHQFHQSYHSAGNEEEPGNRHAQGPGRSPCSTYPTIVGRNKFVHFDIHSDCPLSCRERSAVSESILGEQHAIKDFLQ